MRLSMKGLKYKKPIPTEEMKKLALNELMQYERDMWAASDIWMNRAVVSVIVSGISALIGIVAWGISAGR